jgi:hypothetical protein
MGRLRRADLLEKAKMEIAVATPSQSSAGEALFHLQCALEQEAIQRPLGRFHGLSEEAFLFAIVCELTREGWPLTEGIPQSGTQIPQGQMRSVRLEETSACASCERGLDGQRSGQFANLVRELSSVLARFARQARDEVLRANANAHPLAIGLPARVGMLRGAGNAIVPQLAAEFIGACLDIERGLT